MFTVTIADPKQRFAMAVLLDVLARAGLLDPRCKWVEMPRGLILTIEGDEKMAHEFRRFLVTKD